MIPEVRDRDEGRASIVITSASTGSTGSRQAPSTQAPARESYLGLSENRSLGFARNDSKGRHGMTVPALGVTEPAREEP